MKRIKLGPNLLIIPAFLTVFGLGFVASGCGTVQEGMEEENWSDSTPVSVTARLEYRVDSLSNENRKLQQQYDATAAENKKLNSRNAELESKIASAASKPESTPRATVPPGGYEEALSNYRNRNYQTAIDQFSGLLGSGISGDLADNCEYWIGESYFGMKQYGEAVKHFQSVVSIAGSDKADDAQFMIGHSFQSMGNSAAAREAYRALINNYPTSPLIRRARAKMSGL